MLKKLVAGLILAALATWGVVAWRGGSANAENKPDGVRQPDRIGGTDGVRDADADRDGDRRADADRDGHADPGTAAGTDRPDGSLRVGHQPDDRCAQLDCVVERDGVPRLP